ncbi:AAA family ATPase [Angustibacter sp. McL0619]|uniref:AAA family ATPase n=1 Tax=Angustibacter sp. McL0619 TaxID=3415676 RepID=UPI003CFA9F9B
MSDHPPSQEFGPEQAAWVQSRFQAVFDNVRSMVVGKDDTVALVLQCLLAGGHVLIEDNPGTAKTRLAKAVARSIDGSFSRIQFTPDLLPSDVTGVPIFHPERREFEFRPGAVFANIVLADEINRASPKTQSALLEAMAERQTTVDGTTYPMPKPFLVLATQNSVEMQGTYPLAEAQLDRFTIRTSIGYPGFAHEMQIVNDGMSRREPEDLQHVISASELYEIHSAIAGVFVAPTLVEYMVNIAARTRQLPDLRLGSSSRAVVQLAQLVQARAASQGRHFATADDVKVLVPAAFCHRLLLRPEAAIQGQTAQSLLDDVLLELPVPREPARV